MDLWVSGNWVICKVLERTDTIAVVFWSRKFRMVLRELISREAKPIWIRELGMSRFLRVPVPGAIWTLKIYLKPASRALEIASLCSQSLCSSNMLLIIIGIRELLIARAWFCWIPVCSTTKFSFSSGCFVNSVFPFIALPRLEKGRSSKGWSSINYHNKTLILFHDLLITRGNTTSRVLGVEHRRQGIIRCIGTKGPLNIICSPLPTAFFTQGVFPGLNGLIMLEVYLSLDTVTSPMTIIEAVNTASLPRQSLTRWAGLKHLKQRLHDLGKNWSVHHGEEARH